MIACLGWGSLIWDPRGLPLRGAWRMDGPRLPVEFVRQSFDGRLTLVIYPGARPVPALWALMPVPSLEKAIESLGVRERIAPGRRGLWVGAWRCGQALGGPLAGLPEWARPRGVESVVWTALPPRFGGRDQCAPSREEALEYLCSLSGKTRRRAEEYVRCAPPQTRTRYRESFEKELGWNPSG